MHRLHLEDCPEYLDRHGPVLILGCPRSGTTFLYDCIAAIGKTVATCGELAPARLMHLVGRMTRDGENPQPLLDCVRDSFWQAFWHRRYSRTESLLRAVHRQGCFRDIVSAPSLDGWLFCHKEPFLCFAAEGLMKQFPAAKFIHIYRDGRDNADSLSRSYPNALSNHVLQSPRLSYNNASEIGTWRPFDGWCIPWWIEEGYERDFINATTFGRCTWLWREMTERARSIASVVGTERYIEIGYEQFVSEPLKWGEKIATFLGRPMSRSYRKQLLSAKTSSVGIHTSRLDSTKSADADRFAGKLLRELGYA